MGENIPNLKAKSFYLLLHLQNVKRLLLKYWRFLNLTLNPCAFDDCDVA